MKKILAVATTVVLTLGGATAITTASANASPSGLKYGSCDDLNARYPSGVAKNAKAARRAVNDGYGRPATSKRAKKVYWANPSLDRDGDGTACES